ncbi:hypothetical protein H310_12657 [Aphanomyces invadans]|uniref:Uncharacterized protein n=1 Tax=Aphanomyces invadans TaxID=157072 RepID=A0A024THH5_9STRA|nr:hypothetical protein H310_12657 [Aphanomyces invadans]ETV93414.1 hypothetical protein H310_12657 [Aphanomyces invadans]|eukprot:XP_008878050.1 hypothetical protein H310_12657 [Aphanomyces invadans]
MHPARCQSIRFMRSSVLTVFLSFVSLCLCMFALIFPAWSQQTYSPSKDAAAPTTFQGFGLFAFYSTNTLNAPFYASITTLFFADFCERFAANKPSPNWMLGHGPAFNDALCDTAVIATQCVMYSAAGFAVLALVAAVVACFIPVAGAAERTVSISTFMSSLCMLAVLVLWSVSFQQKLLNIDVIQTAYSQCQSLQGSSASWSCWFYGYSFWVAIAAVLCLLVTTYASAAGRAAKLRQNRKAYDHHLVIALQESAALAEANHSTLNNDTRLQPLLTTRTAGDLVDRELALALQQSKEAHELQQAIDLSLLQQQLDLQMEQQWAIQQQRPSFEQRRLGTQQRLDL